MSEEIELQVDVHSEAGVDNGEKEQVVEVKESPVGGIEQTEGGGAESEPPDTKEESSATSSKQEATTTEKDPEDVEIKVEKERKEDDGEREGGERDTKKEEDKVDSKEAGGEAKDKPEDEQQQEDGVVQEQPTSMATETSEPNDSSVESERVAPVCQLARAQASIQARMRPGMWLPGVRNLHMAREVWTIKATPDECLDKLVAAVDAIPQEELMEISKLDKNRHFVEIFSFTKNCNWLDVVEVTFSNDEEPGTTRGEIVSFSSGVFPAWMPLSFVCNCCCFFAPFSGNGMNTRRIELIKNALQLEVSVRQ